MNEAVKTNYGTYLVHVNPVLVSIYSKSPNLTKVAGSLKDFLLGKALTKFITIGSLVLLPTQHYVFIYIYIIV